MKYFDKTMILFLFLGMTSALHGQTEVKDSIRPLINLTPRFGDKTKMDAHGFIIPDLTKPFASKPYFGKKDSITLRFKMPEIIKTPYPKPKLEMNSFPFANDYEQSNNYKLNYNSYLGTYSFQNTYPTMGTHIQAGASYIITPNNRWEFAAGLYTTKYTIPSFRHGAKIDLGINGSAAYRINDFLKIRAFGQYSVYGQSNSTQGYMTPLLPQSNYGAILELRINDYLEIHGGMERSYNPLKMKWENRPIIYPVFNFKGKER